MNYRESFYSLIAGGAGRRNEQEKHLSTRVDESRVRRVLAHYEAQTEAEAIAEDEAAIENQTQTSMEVPVELVSVVRELIAKHQP